MSLVSSASSLLLLLVYYKLTDSLLGRYFITFCKREKQIQLSFEGVLCVVYMQETHLRVVRLTEHMQQGILQKEKRPCRGHQNQAVKCLCWKAEL